MNQIGVHHIFVLDWLLAYLNEKSTIMLIYRFIILFMGSTRICLHNLMIKNS